MRKFQVEAIEDLNHVSSEIHQLASDYQVICFRGEMGSGKTTLIKNFCHLRGVRDDMSSPTFSIINEYRDSNGQPIYHFDFYRLKNEQEALDIGVEEYLYSGHVCLIEWAYMFPNLIPPQHLEISINLVGEMKREIMLVAHGR